MASCVDDRVRQNGFVELYFMLVLKPLCPVSGGHTISVSVLIFVVSPTPNAFIEKLCNRKICIPKAKTNPGNDQSRSVILKRTVFK